ncbi:hypothetical protein [Pseudomonas nunensis]|uniref:Uncharacterized protein n=1 Tax=Pseudomonas nunensis TaxID=2961896 RepID=A0ABY5EPW3_9PSED|nr:hypothetical protein [Pseudomonas nunensis]KPN90087.1 hypothetical protein AL066_07000 [Pseudomonas nunensis]MCL5225001.1 hypothetical protein [Pseudomonas nunensis]UTO16327.1 hypothetical protein NK667_08245 [Pseudomonas nunensis]
MSDDNVYQQVQLQVSNAAQGQRIVVQLLAQGAPVAWSTGPVFEGVGGISMNVPSGSAFPVSSFSISPSAVTVDTSFSRGGGAEALSFNLTLYLVAQAGIQTFGLRSVSDPGIYVVAGIGNSQPQAVNQTVTLFSWHP